MCLTLVLMRGSKSHLDNNGVVAKCGDLSTAASGDGIVVSFV